MHAAGDDVLGGFIEIGVQEFGKFQKLWPEDLIHHGGGDANHDSGSVLAGPAIGVKIVAAAEGDEELAFPGVFDFDFELCFRYRLVTVPESV